MARQAENRDKNEAEYVELWRRSGCYWIPMKAGAGFDGVLVSPQTGIRIVEVKNPLGFGTKLTDREQEVREQVILRGAAYDVIATLEEALKLIEGS